MQILDCTRHISKALTTELFLIRTLKITCFLLLLIQVFAFSKAYSYGGLPECEGNSGAIPRQNCKDLIHLPLCSLFPEAEIRSYPEITVKNQINCVRQCSDSVFSNPDTESNPPNLRGKHYAIHGVNCIRFCPGNTENGETVHSPSGLSKCISKRCHQIDKDGFPNPNVNCAQTKCSLLTLEELKDNDSGKFSDQTKQYCEVDKKCYEFSKDKLPYIIYRLENPMCKIHDCAPDPNASNSGIGCSAGNDDTLNITGHFDSTYKNAYKQNIDPGFGGDNSIPSICKPLQCEPTHYRQIRCKPENDDNPTVLHQDCDSDSTCNSGYCTKKIDCNLAANKNEIECSKSSNDDNEYYDEFQQNADDFARKSWFYRPKPLSRVNTNRINRNDICYNRDDLEGNGWGWRMRIPLGFTTVDLGYFHDIFQSERSPGHCGASKTGTRGLGYLYLCGTERRVYEEPDWDVGYNDGYVKANYELDNPTYSIKTCLRYVNTGRWGACGKRVCGVFCEFNVCRTQMCGWDKCRTLIVRENNPLECSHADKTGDCSAKMGGGASLDSYIQVRAARYGPRMICTFLDSKGQTAWPGQDDYMAPNRTSGVASYRSYIIKDLNGEEYCVDGVKDEDTGKCTGKNHNDNNWKADIFRAIMRIDHVASPGYEDFKGRKFRPMPCAYIPLRIGPPRLFRIANIDNSFNLFAPPIWISKIKKIKGGADSDNLKTDFHYPEIEVKFGESTALLSLKGNETGEELTKPEHSEASIEAAIGPRTYTANVYVVKEFNNYTQDPILCLYRMQRGSDGITMNKKLYCISREKPVIESDQRSKIITSSSSNTYKDATMDLQLLISKGVDGTNNNCTSDSDDECTAKITFTNAPIKETDCKSAVEEYEFCAQKESCTELLNECVVNEINLSNITSLDPDYKSIMDKKSYCDTTLLKNCNDKWGIADGVLTNVGDYIRSIPTSGISLRPSFANDKAYGWYNEMCIVKGFEDRLINVVAHVVNNGQIKGKCLIDTNQDGVNAANCPDGGNASKNCPCLEANSSFVPSAEYYSRKQTVREAGLCIDIPYPKMCEAILYERNLNNQSDPFYVSGSVNKTSYNNINGVHKSHEDRTNDVEEVRHSEFSATFSGTDNFKGSCNGFWKSVMRGDGLEAKPSMNCQMDGSWDKTNLLNSCIRYSCVEAVADNMVKKDENSTDNEIGIYLGNYSIGEVGETQGAIHGYANWDKYTKTNDFLESRSATSCITGYRKKNSTRNSSGIYAGGTTPTRNCNQLGKWSTVTNTCERITCDAVNPNRDPQDQTQFDEWVDAGGASFPSAKASRSTNEIIGVGTVVEGTCYDSVNDPSSNRTDLRFFKSSNGKNPSRECNHLGKWEAVINPCVTECEAIDTAAEANNINSGFAYWEQAIIDINQGSKDGVIDTSKGMIGTGCYSGYVYNPYSPKDQANIFNPGNVAMPPSKKCISIAATANVDRRIWEAAKNPCVNFCPGSDEDPRIGIGNTKHQSSYGILTINWPKTELGKTVYKSNSDSLTAASFDENEGTYFLKRECGMDGKWKDPQPLCSTNKGVVGKEEYKSDDTIGNHNHLEIGENINANSCAIGYQVDSNDPDSGPPIDVTRSCSYKDNNKNIDEVYLELTSGKECVRTKCTISNGDEFLNGKYMYNATKTIRDYGDTVSVKCGSGYTGGSSIAKCGDYGKWEIIPNNDDVCKETGECFIDWPTKVELAAQQQTTSTVNVKNTPPVIDNGTTYELRLYARNTIGGCDSSAVRHYAYKCEDGKLKSPAGVGDWRNPNHYWGIENINNSRPDSIPVYDYVFIKPQDQSRVSGINNKIVVDLSKYQGGHSWQHSCEYYPPSYKFIWDENKWKKQ